MVVSSVAKKKHYFKHSHHNAESGVPASSALLILRGISHFQDFPWSGCIVRTLCSHISNLISQHFVLMNNIFPQCIMCCFLHVFVYFPRFYFFPWILRLGIALILFTHNIPNWLIFLSPIFYRSPGTPPPGLPVFTTHHIPSISPIWIGWSASCAVTPAASPSYAPGQRPYKYSFKIPQRLFVLIFIYILYF